MPLFSSPVFHESIGRIDEAALLSSIYAGGHPKIRLSSTGAWCIAPMPILGIEGKRDGVNLGNIPGIKDGVDAAVAVQITLRGW